MNFILTNYINASLSNALYDKLDDGSFAGRIPACKGAIAFGASLRECEQELHSTLEDWLLLGFKLGHSLPAL
jgi:predicted RNase H-like HicB family nuclease